MIEFVQGEPRPRPTSPHAYPTSVIESGLALGGVGRDANGNFALCIQHDPGRFARIDLVARAAQRLVELCEEHGETEVCLGRICTGVLPWSEVRTVLTRACERSRTVTVRVYERQVPR